MVLGDLSRRLTSAMSTLTGSNVVDDKLLDAVLKEICSALLESDVNVKLVGNLRKSVKQKVNLKDLPAGINKKRIVQKTVVDELIKLVDPQVEAYKPVKGKTNVIMFVGLQGSGKTTSCTKLALFYQKQGFKSCLVCADTFRAGAFDQLKQNATKARIPFYGSYTETDPVRISKEGVDKFKKEKFEIIIVDTSGRHRQEKELFAEMIQIQQAVKPHQTIMVLDASIGQAAESQSKAFKESANFGAIIITKMDGHAKGGGAISAVAVTQTPIVFIGTGEHMHDLERFSAQPFISKLLGMGDIQGLMEHVQSLNLDKNKGMIKNLEQGTFTVRDLRDQMSNILKLGPLGKVASMLPGMGQMFESMGGDDTSGRVKRLISIMDSMTEKELDSDGRVFNAEPTRMTRIARGSGTSVREVEEVLSQHRMMLGMAKKMGGKNGMMAKMNAPKNAQQAASIQRKLQSQGTAGGLSLPGGMNMADMMKMAGQMMGGGAGGMPDMNSMMGQFGEMFGGGRPSSLNSSRNRGGRR